MPSTDTTPDAPETFAEYDQLDDKHKELVSALSWIRLLQLAKKCSEVTAKEGIAEHGDVKIDVSKKSKDERKLFHDIIKIHFPHLDSKTENEGEDKKFIVVLAKKKLPSNHWPRNRPKHLMFHLCKEGMDTIHVLGQLSRELRLANIQIKCAGTKDKRSISTQKITIKHVTAENLSRAVKRINVWQTQRFNAAGPTVNVGNFRYVKEGIDLGDLNGNKFTIVLRDVTEPQETIEAALSTLKTNGFINYFGQQRFGTVPTIKTSDIGLALIKEDWQGAIELILKPRGNETPQMTRMRAHWWMYRNPGDAVVLLGSRITQSKTIEATLLQGLAREHENNYVGALSHLQKKTQLLYLHAYQSICWNKAVSLRIQKFGFEVLVGDLVLLPEGDLDQKKEAIEDNDTSKRERKEARITKVTEANRDKYTIADVVMPIPGFKVAYPANEELKKIYIDILEADGLKNGFESLKHSVDLYSLSGDYRYVILKPSDVSWKFTRYDDPNKDILVSDFALLQGKVHADASEVGEAMAVILELTLPPSTYATMALRESMKIDMNKGNQAKLTETLLAQKRKVSDNGDDFVDDDEEAAKKAKVTIVQD